MDEMKNYELEYPPVTAEYDFSAIYEDKKITGKIYEQMSEDYLVSARIEYEKQEEILVISVSASLDDKENNIKHRELCYLAPYSEKGGLLAKKIGWNIDTLSHKFGKRKGTVLAYAIDTILSKHPNLVSNIL